MYRLKAIDLTNSESEKKLRAFLAENGLSLETDVEEAVGIFESDLLIAACGRSGKVLKGFAVREEYRDQNLTSTLVGEMIRRLAEHGIYKNFVYTKLEHQAKFENIGYRFLAKGGKAVLLETGLYGIDIFIDGLKAHRSEGTINGCIVMNCNPFTLGHRYLIEKARAECDILYILLVQEDRSLFPFKVRKALVQEGIRDFPNVRLLDGGDYIVSSATFPGYFIRKPSERVQTEAELDIDLFVRHTAPALGIVKRFAGTEPSDPVTATYNKVMRENLPSLGIEFVEIERLKASGMYISASDVRGKIRDGDMSGLEQVLPPSTLRYLRSSESAEVRKKISESSALH